MSDFYAHAERVGAQRARLLGNKDLTEALLSRLRHQCQPIRINGPSLREPQGSPQTANRNTPVPLA
jgi:hypothetical protein